jgi:hypothetical protein
VHGVDAIIALPGKIYWNSYSRFYNHSSDDAILCIAGICCAIMLYSCFVGMCCANMQAGLERGMSSGKWRVKEVLASVECLL